MKLVIVESPTKAKTINKYLGSDYQILASYGHVRDLPSKNGSVKPDDDFFMTWETDSNSEKHLKDIIHALKGANELFLATDPDREGEAISWHVWEVLNNRGVLKNIPVKRVVFHEITKSAVTDAINNPRELDQDLVEAYLARRALDYLVGFTLSPLLWRKLPGSRSAGRVQSVALRLITDREDEIEAFISQEYWSVLADLKNSKVQQIQTRLTHLDGQKLEKFSLANEAAAQKAVSAVKSSDYTVKQVEKKQTKRHPAPPFTTSTLQQEAFRKLGFGGSRTMRIAQQLYEGIDIGGEVTGLITYMRTDSVNIAAEALNASHHYIEAQYGKAYLPEKPRAYKTKAKNAQEAHEAIRPTDVTLDPKKLSHILQPDQFKVYSLIWKRLVASQMESALIDQVAIDFVNTSNSVSLRATGSSIAFDGFLKVYQEGRDDEEEEEEGLLPPVNVGDAFTIKLITPQQHFTQPPPRYSEASLVKKMEELGIGRPSTYASILQTLQDRDYINIEKKQLRPKDRGRIVTAFLINFFAKYVQFDFTAELEEQLDEISGGRLKWKQVLSTFWTDFHHAVEGATGLTITQVLDRLNEDLAKMLFPVAEEGKDPRICPKCTEGQLSLKVGRYGAFVGCSNYPECSFTRQLGAGDGNSANESLNTEPKELGIDPKTDLKITLRKGPYGFYLQWGEVGVKPKEKPKRITIPSRISIDEVTLETALALSALPRSIGVHPDSSKEISGSIGRFGPYIKYQDRFISLKGDDDVLTVSLDRALEIIAQAPEKKERPAKKAKTIVKKKTTKAKPKAKKTPSKATKT